MHPPFTLDEVLGENMIYTIAAHFTTDTSIKRACDAAGWASISRDEAAAMATAAAYVLASRRHTAHINQEPPK